MRPKTNGYSAYSQTRAAIQQQPNGQKKSSVAESGC